MDKRDCPALISLVRIGGHEASKLLIYDAWLCRGTCDLADCFNPLMTFLCIAEFIEISMCPPGSADGFRCPNTRQLGEGERDLSP